MLALLRFATEVGTAADWIVIFIAVIIAVFTFYVGVAMCATLRASDAAHRKVCYQIFCALLRCLTSWRHW